MNYSSLKSDIAAVVRENGNQEITGNNLQGVLTEMIDNSVGTGYLYKGIVTPETQGGTPDQNVFYLAGAGTYTNFGGSHVVADGSLGIFSYNGTWTFETIAFGAGNNAVLYTTQSKTDTEKKQARANIGLGDGTIDDAPTANSENIVKSGGVYDTLAEKVAYKEINIISNGTAIEDTLITYAAGERNTNTSWDAYFLDVSKCSKIRCYVSKPSNVASAAIAFYRLDNAITANSANGELKLRYIKSASVAAVNGNNWYEANVPSDAVYAVISNNTSNLATPKAYAYIDAEISDIPETSEVAVRSNGVLSAINSVKGFFSKLEYLFPVEYTENTRYICTAPVEIGNTVTTESGSTYKAYKFSVTEGSVYTIHNLQQRGYYYHVIFVGSTMGFISGCSMPSDTSTHTINNLQVTVPEGTVYMLVISYIKVPYVTRNITYATASKQDVENIKIDSIYNEKEISIDVVTGKWYVVTDNSVLGTSFAETSKTSAGYAKLAVVPGDKYNVRFSTAGSSTGMRYCAFLDADNKLVGASLRYTEDSGSAYRYDTVTVPEGVYYMVISSKLTSIHITKANDTARIEEVMTPTAATRYLDKAGVLDAACRYRVKSNTSHDWQMLILADPHNDEQAVENTRLVSGVFDTIDAVVCVGDINSSRFNEPEWIAKYQQIMAASKKPWYNVIGNHDAGNVRYVGDCGSNAQLYSAFIKPIVDNGWLSNGEYTEGKCYYYHDFVADGTKHHDNIRLIVVDEYDEDVQVDDAVDAGWEAITYDSSYEQIQFSHSYSIGDCVNCGSCIDYSFKAKNNLTTPANRNGITVVNMPCYKMIRGARVISKTQLEWFISTLNSTPEGYRVVIATHAAFSPNATNQYQLDFAQTDWTGSPGSSLPSLMQNDVFKDIVDAYINRGQYSDDIVFTSNEALGDATYMNTEDGTVVGGGGTYAYSISANFANAKGVFMCYLGGHVHRDMIWKTVDEIQYQISPILANSVSWQSFNFADIRRSYEDGDAKDCLTVITFRTKTNNYQYSENKIVLNKIGVDVTWNMEDRKKEIIKLDE